MAALSLAAITSPLAAVPAQASPAPASGLDVYVSPTGRDTGSGTAGHPFRTLEHARDYVRDVKSRVHGDVRVLLMSGTYRLSHTFALTARDSGSNGHRVVYGAAPGAQPVISGGTRVTGWTRADSAGKVYKAEVGDLDTRQLYVNGELETRARSGKNPPGFSKTSTGYTFTDTSISGYKRPSDLEVVSSWGWKLQRCPVQSISGNTMTMRQPCWHNANLQQGQEIQNPTWLENARELLDTPGEWYLDKGEGEIYYMPEAGQDLSTATVTVPRVQDLVDLNGTEGTPVSNVSFEGITFSYSTWLAPSSSDGLIEGQAGFRMVGNDNPDFDSTRLKWQKTPGAVNVNHGHQIGFQGNTFTHLGAVGLNLNTGTQGTDITGNTFRQIAATGIQIGGTDVIDAHPDDPRDITKDTTVDNNVVTEVADQYNGSVGILAGYTDHTVISHNKIHDLPYSGISVGWGWGLTDKGGDTNYPGNSGVPVWDTPTTSRDNKVTDNDISDIMKSQADGGAIYTLSTNPGGVVAGELHPRRSGAGLRCHLPRRGQPLLAEHGQRPVRRGVPVAADEPRHGHHRDRQLHDPAQVQHPGQQHGRHRGRQHHRRLLRPAPGLDREQRRPPAALPSPRSGPGRHRPPGAHRARHPDRGHRLPDRRRPQLAGCPPTTRASRATPSTVTAPSSAPPERPRCACPVWRPAGPTTSGSPPVTRPATSHGRARHWRSPCPPAPTWR